VESSENIPVEGLKDDDHDQDQEEKKEKKARGSLRQEALEAFRATRQKAGDHLRKTRLTTAAVVEESENLGDSRLFRVTQVLSKQNGMNGSA